MDAYVDDGRENVVPDEFPRPPMCISPEIKPSIPE